MPHLISQPGGHSAPVDLAVCEHGAGALRAEPRAAWNMKKNVDNLIWELQTNLNLMEEWKEQSNIAVLK